MKPPAVLYLNYIFLFFSNHINPGGKICVGRVILHVLVGPAGQRIPKVILDCHCGIYDESILHSFSFDLVIVRIGLAFS